MQKSIYIRPIAPLGVQTLLPTAWSPELQNKAGKGDDDAQQELARAYEMGAGVKRDYAEAAKWYRKAAEQRDHIAYSPLALLYSQGLGVKQDWEEAYFWYSLNVVSSNNPTSLKPGLASEDIIVRENAGAHLTPHQKAAVDKRIAAWMKGHSDTER
jgi:hypothetical protein